MKSSKSLQSLRLSAVVLLSATGFGQLAGLPMKAGLWESTGSTSMGNRPPKTMRICYQGSLTMQDYLNQMLANNPQIKCSIDNRSLIGHTFTYDETCTGEVAGGGSIKVAGHGTMEFPDSDHVISKQHSAMSMTMQGKPMNMDMDITSSAKFISPDCGDVKPFVMPVLPAAK